MTHPLRRMCRAVPGLLLGLAWLLPCSALAAISVNSADFGGAATTSVVAGASVPVTLSVTTSGSGAADNWDSFAWRIASTPPGGTTCNGDPDFNGDGTRVRTYNLTAPVAPGTYNLYLIAYNSDDCTSGASAVLTLSNAITVQPITCDPPPNIPAGVTVSCVCDNFNRSSLSPSTIFGQDWLTSATDGTGVLPDIVNSAYLRLTSNTANNAKAATVPAAFPAAGNYISVEFLHYAYSGSGADGMAVTLSDSSVPAVPGAYGGSLGYAQKTGPNINGFAGGWIGVGLDEYGNYQNPTEGRDGGPGFRPDTVAVRGSGSGIAGYRWLQGNTAALSPGIDNAGSGSPAPGYRYQIVVDARNAGAATPQTLVAVNRDLTGVGNSYSPVIEPFDAFARATTLGFTQAPVPTNWQISFTGSTGGSTNIHEVGGLRICAQTVNPPANGVADNFAIIDEAYGTPAIAVQNYLTGRIYTKLAGTPFRLNVAAIENNQIQPDYVRGGGNRDVDIKLVDNSDGVCVLNPAQANYCNAACRAKPAVPGGSQTLRFFNADAGQKQSANFTIPGAWSQLVAVLDNGSITACSTDAFAVRPSAFTAVSSTAGNAALSGTPALRAGSDTFGMTVATPTAGYAGAAAVPAINPAAMQANAAGWTVGTLTPGSFPAATASSSTGSFTYSEVGHFRFLGYDPAADATSPRGVYDTTWTAVDQGAQQDCIADSYANTRDTSGSFATNPNYGKFGCRFGITATTPLFGRFVPASFALVSGSVGSFCAGPTKNFGYMGQPRVSVSYVIEARNGLNAKTLNYDAGLAYPVGAPQLVVEDQAAAHQGCDLASRLGGLPAAAWTAGSYGVNAVAATFSRPGSVPPQALDPAACVATRANAGGPFWDLDIGVRLDDGDAALASPDMNAASAGTCSGAGCDARRLGGTAALLGRLNLLNAYGSELLPLQVPVRAEYYNGSSWTLNTEDRCTVLGAAALGMGNVTPAAGAATTLALDSSSVTVAPATLSGGAGSFRLAPTVKGPGSVDVALNLGAGLTSLTRWCGSWSSGPVAGTGTTPVPDMSYLADNWCGAAADKAPAARLRFGSPRAPYIYLRERY